jgi:hypothetical protein
LMRERDLQLGHACFDVHERSDPRSLLGCQPCVFSSAIAMDLL